MLDFRGESWENLTTGVDVRGLVLSGSDFDSDFLLFNRTNDMPVRFREGMARSRARAATPGVPPEPPGVFLRTSIGSVWNY